MHNLENLSIKEIYELYSCDNPEFSYEEIINTPLDILLDSIEKGEESIIDTESDETFTHSKHIPSRKKKAHRSIKKKDNIQNVPPVELITKRIKGDEETINYSYLKKKNRKYINIRFRNPSNGYINYCKK